MVKPSIVLGAVPFVGLASALYFPHDNDAHHSKLFGVATYDSHSDGAEKHKSLSAEQLHDSKIKNAVRMKGQGHKSLKHHQKSHKKSKGFSLPKLEGVISNASPEDVIPDHYIVVLKNDDSTDTLTSTLEFLREVSNSAMQSLVSRNVGHELLNTENGFEIKHVHDLNGSGNALRGFSGHFLPEVAEKLASHPNVHFVERDSIVRINKPKEEDEAPWGLARVSHRDSLGLSTYNKYLYDGEAGEGVTSYIVDTGIYVDHEDFEGRAAWGKTMPLGDSDIDAHGHGSHCAGTIGGKKYGVAKKAHLVAVKVLGSDGSGTMSDVIGGVEYVVESHRKEQKSKGSKFKGSTANMSLGGGKSPSLEIAVNAATQAGVHFAVAAGNENQDACNVSPAGADGVVTVGATDLKDDRAYFSNYGKCVDIFAPGVNVLSVGTVSPSSSAIMSGTSMASPHVAGLLTYFVSLQPTSDSEYSIRGALTTKELKKHLIEFGTDGKISDLDVDSPNVLAFNGGGDDISDFWIGAISDDEDHEEHDHNSSFLESAENLYESVVDYVETWVENSQDLAARII